MERVPANDFLLYDPQGSTVKLSSPSMPLMAEPVSPYLEELQTDLYAGQQVRVVHPQPGQLQIPQLQQYQFQHQHQHQYQYQHPPSQAISTLVDPQQDPCASPAKSCDNASMPALSPPQPVHQWLDHFEDSPVMSQAQEETLLHQHLSHAQEDTLFHQHQSHAGDPQVVLDSIASDFYLQQQPQQQQQQQPPTHASFHPYMAQTQWQASQPLSLSSFASVETPLVSAVGMPNLTLSMPAPQMMTPRTMSMSFDPLDSSNQMSALQNYQVPHNHHPMDWTANQMYQVPHDPHVQLPTNLLSSLVPDTLSTEELWPQTVGSPSSLMALNALDLHHGSGSLIDLPCQPSVHPYYHHHQEQQQQPRPRQNSAHQLGGHDSFHMQNTAFASATSIAAMPTTKSQSPENHFFMPLLPMAQTSTTSRTMSPSMRKNATSASSFVVGNETTVRTPKRIQKSVNPKGEFKKHSCPDCKVKCSSIPSLNRHRTTHEWQGKWSPIRCEGCHAGLSNPFSVQRHCMSAAATSRCNRWKIYSEMGGVDFVKNSYRFHPTRGHGKKAELVTQEELTLMRAEDDAALLRAKDEAAMFQ